jgi:hypothetical protein
MIFAAAASAAAADAADAAAAADAADAAADAAAGDSDLRIELGNEPYFLCNSSGLRGSCNRE